MAPEHEPDKLGIRVGDPRRICRATAFGRVADLVGRKKILNLLVAVIMVVGVVASALARSQAFLILARFVLGLGIGGDYPVSAVLMSEYASRDDWGRLVGLVFSMQALGRTPSALSWRLGSSRPTSATN